VSLLKNIFLKGAGMESQWQLLAALGLFAGLISFMGMRSFDKILR
jgi:hypothetical protein